MTQQPAIATQLALPPLDQIGLVVPDIEAALNLYAPLFGPFHRMQTRVDNADYQGIKADCELLLAFGRSGDIEIELIEITAGESPHRDFIKAGGNGLHHVRFRIDRLEEKISQAQALDYRTIWYKRLDDDIAWAYLARDGDPLIIEFLQMPV